MQLRDPSEEGGRGLGMTGSSAVVAGRRREPSRRQRIPGAVLAGFSTSGARGAGGQRENRGRHGRCWRFRRGHQGPRRTTRCGRRMGAAPPRGTPEPETRTSSFPAGNDRLEMSKTETVPSTQDARTVSGKFYLNPFAAGIRVYLFPEVVLS